MGAGPRGGGVERRAPPPRPTWVPRAAGAGGAGHRAMGLRWVSGRPSICLPRERSPPPQGLSHRLWVCPLNHRGLAGFRWAYSRVKSLPLPAPASLGRRVEVLGCFLFPHCFLRSRHRALTSRWARESRRALRPPRCPVAPTCSPRPWPSSPDNVSTEPESPRKSPAWEFGGGYLRGAVPGPPCGISLSFLGSGPTSGKRVP